MKKSIELQKLSTDELNQEIISLRRKQFNLRVKKANGSLEKSDQVRKVRRSIARAKTFISQKSGELHG